METFYLKKKRLSNLKLYFHPFFDSTVLGLLVMIGAVFILNPYKDVISLGVSLTFATFLSGFYYIYLYSKLKNEQQTAILVTENKILYRNGNKEKQILRSDVSYVGFWDYAISSRTISEMSFWNISDEELLVCEPFDWNADDCKMFLKKVGVKGAICQADSKQYFSEIQKLGRSFHKPSRVLLYDPFK